MAREEESTGEERRAARRRKTRRRILDTAMDILVQHGHEGFTIARLAADLDYAVGALQFQIVTRLDADLARVLALIPNETEHDALKRVFAAATVYESLTWRRPTEHHVLALSLGDPRPLLKKEEIEGVLPALEALLARMTGVIAEAVKAGALGPGDARQQALVLWGSTYGIMALRKLERVRPAFADAAHARRLHVALVVGWGGAPDVAEAASAQASALVKKTFRDEK